MPLSKNYRAYDDVRIAFDRALDSDNGIKIPCKDRGEAVHLRSRFNQYRAITRAQSLEMYTEGELGYGHSPYERLVLRIPRKSSPDDNILYIEPIVKVKFTMEDIEPDEKLSTKNEK